MEKIFVNLFDTLEIGDEVPIIIMGVLNLSPESFYKGSVYEKKQDLKRAALNMIKNGAKMLDLGARSTAPWSKIISIEEELARLTPAMKTICQSIPANIIISVDTQYRKVAEAAYGIAQQFKRSMIINDVSCLHTDPTLEDFIIEKDMPSILMASKKVPGDLLTLEQIIQEFEDTISRLNDKGYDEKKIILDPGIGHWIEEKVFSYDLNLIANLKKLKILNKPILVALSRKSFIGNALNIQKPKKRFIGTLAATAVAVFNGAHIVRTHDVNRQTYETIKMAEALKTARNF